MAGVVVGEVWELWNQMRGCMTKAAVQYIMGLRKVDTAANIGFVCSSNVPEKPRGGFISVTWSLNKYVIYYADVPS